MGAKDKAGNIVSLANCYPHSSILEIGAGFGSILLALSDRGFGDNPYALEVSTRAVETIGKRGISTLRESRLFDGYDIPYADNSFDLVILSHVIEHVEHPRKLLYEAGRVGAFVFIEVPLEDTLRLARDFVFKDGHINFHSPGSIRRLAQTCNMEVVDQQITLPSREVYEYLYGQTGTAKYFAKKALLKIAPQAAPRLFTYFCSLICRRYPNGEGPMHTCAR